jgi:putative endonuclease
MKLSDRSHNIHVTYYVYIVRCCDNTLYTGYTTDLDKRIDAHNNHKSGSKYCKSRRPVNLVYFEEYDNQTDALKREYAIKQLSRKQKDDLICKPALTT